MLADDQRPIDRPSAKALSHNDDLDCMREATAGCPQCACQVCGQWGRKQGLLLSVPASAGYPNMMRFKAGKMTPSPILRRLGSESKKNMHCFAFQELGRVIRTLFLLKYLNNPEFRRTFMPRQE